MPTHCSDDAASRFALDFLMICRKIKMTKTIANRMKLPMKIPVYTSESTAHGQISMLREWNAVQTNWLIRIYDTYSIELFLVENKIERKQSNRFELSYRFGAVAHPVCLQPLRESSEGIKIQHLIHSHDGLPTKRLSNSCSLLLELSGGEHACCKYVRMWTESK